MPTLIFKKFRTSEKVELEFDNVEGLSVEEVREKVSSSMEVPIEELLLLYGGRILKNGKTVTDYFVVAGCTIFVMSGKSKVVGERSERSEGTGLLENKRVLAMIARIIGSPGLLQGVMQGTSLGGNSAIQHIVDSPELMASFTDPDNILEYIRANPPVASVMEDFIRQVLGPGFDEAEHEEQSLVNLLDGFLDDQTSMMEEEDGEEEEEGEEEEVQLALAQEQMFEHSQALQAHYQQQQQQQQQQEPQSGAVGPPPLQQERFYNAAASQQHVSLLRPTTGAIAGITREQLASALASAMETTPIAPVPPQEGYRSSSHSVMSVPEQQGGSSVQAGSLHNIPVEPPPPPNPTPFSSIHPSRSSSNPGHASSQSGLASSTGPINPAILQQALSDIMAGNPSDYNMQDMLWRSSQVTTRSSAEETGSRDHRQQENTAEDLSALAQRYSEQLEQLHLMGILDDAACLQALAATEGDIMAALEILYTQ